MLRWTTDVIVLGDQITKCASSEHTMLGSKFIGVAVEGGGWGGC